MLKNVLHNQHFLRTIIGFDESIYGWWIGATDLNRLTLILKNLQQFVSSSERDPGTGPTPLSQWTTLTGLMESQTMFWETKTVP